MLSLTEIKALLLHESQGVRQLAADFFRDRDDHDPDLVNIAAEAVRRYGFAGVPEVLSGPEMWPTTPEAWDNWRWLWAQAGNQRLNPDDAETMPIQWFLTRGLRRAPTAWAKQYEAEIRSQSHFDHEAWAVIAAREEWATWTPERRWQHLQNYVTAWDEADEYPREVDGPYVEMLIQTVAQSDVPTNTEIEERLESYDDSNGDWLEVLLVRLAGLRRIEAVIPRLVDCLGDDDDAMPNAAQKALIRIGTDAVVGCIEEQFHDADWSWQLYATGVLEAIGVPAAEEALLSLSEGVLDEGIDASVGSALLHMFSERGIAVVRRLVLAGYDVTMDSLEDSLPFVVQVLGVEFPIDPDWEAAAKRCEQERNKSWEEFREAFYRNQTNSGLPDDDFSDSDDDFIDEDEFDAPSIPSGTFVRVTQKVGRNDPCTCGSGKKYKKCCGVAGPR